MKFGPGKTNQFVLIETRRDFLMWNMQDESIFSKMPKENVLAIDWISSDRMVYLEQERGYSDIFCYVAVDNCRRPISIRMFGYPISG